MSSTNSFPIIHKANKSSAELKLLISKAEMAETMIESFLLAEVCMAAQSLRRTQQLIKELREALTETL